MKASDSILDKPKAIEPSTLPTSLASPSIQSDNTTALIPCFSANSFAASKDCFAVPITTGFATLLKMGFVFLGVSSSPLARLFNIRIGN